MKNLRTFESFLNERRASMVGRYPKPDYDEVMDLLDMAQEFIKTKFNSYREGKPIEMYWSDDLVRFDDSKYRGNIAHGFDKRAARKEGLFTGKSEALYTLQKANYNPEETKKEVEGRSKGKIKVELSIWKGEVRGVNYIFN